MTQKEAAIMMKCNQSSITKSLMGNVQFGVKAGGEGVWRNSKGSLCKNYGRSLKKLRRVLMADVEVLDVLAEMYEEVNG